MPKPKLDENLLMHETPHKTNARVSSHTAYIRVQGVALDVVRSQNLIYEAGSFGIKSSPHMEQIMLSS